ncbi:MAG: methyltransferase domain-containing protein [Gammaproteobacteria bacterium]|nr:methyltransferase domain-containing protein [Gammaproteobacteria bacterium]
MDTKQRKTMIQNAFDTVAGGYDHPSLAFFPDTADYLLNCLSMTDDQHLLDVCTGTGMVALKAARQLSQGKVTGIDLSSGMLSQAATKAQQQGLTNVDFVNMDLDELQFDGQLFDLASCSFDLFFIDDMNQAMSNIARVVKPGGKIAISSFTGDAFEPYSQMFLDCYQSFGKEIPPLSWKRLDTEESLRSVYAAAGIDDVKIHFESLSYDMENESHWWDVVWNAGYRGLLNQLTENQQLEFKKRHLSEVAGYCQHNGASLNTDIVIAIGTKV